MRNFFKFYLLSRLFGGGGRGARGRQGCGCIGAIIAIIIIYFIFQALMGGGGIF
ncbi:hypothetical protein BH23BAC1_BH23BAC1_34700 [soil metagenome]